MTNDTEQNDRMEHEWNLDHVNFTFKFASPNVLVDDFEKRLGLKDAKECQTKSGCDHQQNA